MDMHIDTDKLLAHAERARALLTGADALLVHAEGTASGAAEVSIREASAEIDKLTDMLEGLAAREHERERAERLHREASERTNGGGR